MCIGLRTTNVDLCCGSLNEQDPVAREGLSDPIGIVELNDCRVTFRRQVATNDLWSVVSGPLGTFAFCLIEDEVLRRVQAGRPGRDPSRDESSRRRTTGWEQVRIEGDLVIAVRARGDRLSYAHLFGDGAAFGGGESWLPSVRRSGLLERARARLSGVRGDSAQIYRHEG